MGYFALTAEDNDSVLELADLFRDRSELGAPLEGVHQAGRPASSSTPRVTTPPPRPGLPL